MQLECMNCASGCSQVFVTYGTIFKMEFSPPPDENQARILRSYTALHQLRPAWSGALILFLGLDSAGSSLSVASNVAGAVSLAIDNDPRHLREVTRTGAVDFTVTTLDEAIRAMKNEVRKQTPLSVALNADPILALNEILDRGLAPQLFSTFLPPKPQITQAATALRSLGASLIDFSESTPHPPGFQSSQSLFTPLVEDRGWNLQTFVFDTPSALRSFDTRALEILPAAVSPNAPDALRRRWLESAPRILQRQRPPRRTLWLTEPEANSLRPLFRAKNPVKP
jgi:urocanate hydratase